MTDTRGPKPCHYDRTLRQRVLNEHRDDCPGDHTCPAQGRGCAPCTAPHCAICGREHATNATPQTCPECQGKIDDDLADIQASYTALALEAMYAGGDGRLVAAAPIPGGDAAVLIGPTVRLDVVRISRHTLADHRRSDPLPPLAVLAQWEDMYRAYLRHTRAPRASIAGTIRYLRDQLPYIAQRIDGPDFQAFTRQVRNLRSQLEHALHDEREPERGVECFECGDQLVRRFRDPKRCRHSTKARRWVQTLASYRLQVHGTEWYAARLPCDACAKAGQGGIDDPAAGRSWECPGCRKEYGVGEYHTAVRRDLVDNQDSWTNIAGAASAATTLTQSSIGDRTIRGWVGKGWVRSRVEMTKAGLPGMRVVFWPDVRREALRMAAGLHHCTHGTPAREWLKVLASYPELDVWENEVEASYEECERCSNTVMGRVGLAGRHADGRKVS